MPVVDCPHCRKKLHPPDRLAGRRVTCPRCEAVLMVPLLSDSAEELAMEAPTPPPPSGPEEPPLPAAARIGIIALMLGCVSVLILCLPYLNYASILLSGIGVFLSLWGLFRSHLEGDTMLSRSLTGGAGAGGFGARARDYPLAGIVACLLALTLAVLPILMGGGSPD